MSPDTGRLTIFSLAIAGMMLFAWNMVLRWDELGVERFIQWLGFVVFLAGVATRNAVGLGSIADSWDLLGIWLVIFGLSSINTTILIAGVRLTLHKRAPK